MSLFKTHPSGLRNRTPPAENRLTLVPVPDVPAPAKFPTSATPANRRQLFGVSRTNFRLLIASLTLSLYALFQFGSTPPFPESYALCSRSGAGIVTVDDAYPRVQCIVVHRSRFADVGTLEEVKQRWSEASASSNSSDVLPASLHVRYIHKGHVVVPGLSDSHAHILEYGAMKIIRLEETETVEETVSRVKDYILANPDIHRNKTQFIEGWGWDHTKWKFEAFPTTDDLEADSVVAGRPIVLQSKDGHALWVSKKVVQSIQPMPDNVPGGIIIRDASGKPTGVFMDNAQMLVNRTPPTHAMLESRFNATVKDALAAGLTSIHDAGFDPVSLAFFRRQAENGKLPIRIYGMTHFDETNADYWGDRTTKIIGAGNDRLTARSVKIFADGALRSGGAALYEPYTDNPSTRGVMRIEPELLNKVIPHFMKDGWQVNVHAIGDRANGIVLDAFEEALKQANVSALRPRLEHAQILAEADMARFGKLGVIASIQPTHATDDMWYGEDRLGPERVKGLYAFRSILDHGARITLGSDFPVEGVNPLAGFYAAITRLSQDGRSPHGPGGWFPEQRMTREEALRGMTMDPAYASFSEDTLGSITPGKRADYVVLSQDIMAVPVTEIMKTRVSATVIDGRPAYGTI